MFVLSLLLLFTGKDHLSDGELCCQVSVRLKATSGILNDLQDGTKMRSAKKVSCNQKSE